MGGGGRDKKRREGGVFRGGVRGGEREGGVKKRREREGGIRKGGRGIRGGKR